MLCSRRRPCRRSNPSPWLRPVSRIPLAHVPIEPSHRMPLPIIFPRPISLSLRPIEGPSRSALTPRPFSFILFQRCGRKKIGGFGEAASETFFRTSPGPPFPMRRDYAETSPKKRSTGSGNRSGSSRPCRSRPCLKGSATAPHGGARRNTQKVPLRSSRSYITVIVFGGLPRHPPRRERRSLKGGVSGSG